MRGNIGERKRREDIGERKWREEEKSGREERRRREEEKRGRERKGGGEGEERLVRREEKQTEAENGSNVTPLDWHSLIIVYSFKDPNN